jgi:chromosome segregation ATPase
VTGLESVLPALGYTSGLGVLLYLVIHLLRALRDDRDRYVTELARKQAEVTAEEAAHEETQKRLDEAREARRIAEDMAAEMRREVQQLRAEVQTLRDEVQRLRTATGAT